ncbi:glycosyltransferase [Nonomuraea longicatena]|uniref:Glycosyltransferase n=1 Tax=Nonomuraea longicatena TaxID=83682 RepID=A0ABP3ZQE2_9ACTN
MTPSVLHVSQPVDGGVARYVGEAAADQAARGWSVAVAAPAEGPLPRELAARGVACLPWEATRSPGPATLREARALAAVVAGFAPDVVHLHSAKAGLAGRLALRGRIPTIFQPHGWSWLACDGPMASASAAWERLAARWTDALVCVGDGEAAQGWGAGIRHPLVVIRNGVDPARFVPADVVGRATARGKLGLPLGAPLAVCVGRLTRQKGQDVLLDAWPAVRRRCPDAVLALVGDGDLRAALERVAGPGVVFAGPAADVRPWYAAADLVVLPSRWEGLPLIALEALASGRSVVGTDIPGLAEVLTPEVGALVPPDDTTALTAALARRLGHPPLVWDEGQAAVIRAKEFDLRVTLDLLAELTSATARRPCA